MNQVTLVTHASPENTIPGLKYGDAKNAPVTFRPGVKAADMIGLTWVFTDNDDHNYHYSSHLAYSERRCTVIE